VENAEADLELLHEALCMHFGDIPEDFVPPFFEQAGKSFQTGPWIWTWRDLLLAKYKDPARVENQIKFLLPMLAETCLEEAAKKRPI
jgi:hypothetical protein